MQVPPDMGDPSIEPEQGFPSVFAAGLARLFKMGSPGLVIGPVVIMLVSSKGSFSKRDLEGLVWFFLPAMTFPARTPRKMVMSEKRMVNFLVGILFEKGGSIWYK